MVGISRRFRVRGGVATLVQATKVYQRATRREPGNVRCELWQATDDDHSFTLFEVFRDGFAHTQHVMSSHAQAWQQEIAPLLEGSIADHRSDARVMDVVPPPLPLGSRPALESSQPFGGALSVGAAPTLTKTPQLALDVESIEVAAARDHIPLRSAQPCVVVAAFAVDATGAHGVGRTVYRFKPPASLPASLLGSQRLLDVPLLQGALPLRVCVVVISVEENGGTDVQAIYQALADAHDLSFWARAESCPAPSSLAECSATTLFGNAARRVEVLLHDAGLADRLRDDTWAGAALGCFELTHTSPERRARFHTAADDGRNDWLMTLRCRVT